MRATVNHDLCQGHGQCQDAAPDLFEVRDDGFAYVLVESVTDSVQCAALRDAATRCPADAIELIDEA